ncbi:MAG: SDR family oxidoreductase [Armatimonadota bacterium]|nr:SDR family oxidoreductase [Armatimonadota bacterium]MDR7440286.1 SDR family oxidoreductase [Armatimonadota bacterium]MDR7444822.1 SDR family oxidoreductase [Armatimonadota bacterium]MDR7569989.1 SDR family oxidoreductase [Armatimonadota bacterium]MDR7615153.1 SDR family oxidoreductase [Armatimonadota bacterium]
MAQEGAVVIIGGTRGIGLEIARHYAGQGRSVVISGRDPDRAATVAREIGPTVQGIGLDLTRPEEVPSRLSGIGTVDGLVLAAITRDQNTVREYNIPSAMNLVTLKLVGYTAVVHALHSRLTPHSAIVIFGGLAKERPYPGSTTVTTVNAGVSGLVRTLAIELAPVRVNAIHPGIVADSPYWAGNTAMLERVQARTPTGRLVRMADVVHAVAFLLENPAVNGVELYVDGGWVFG